MVCIHIVYTGVYSTNCMNYIVYNNTFKSHGIEVMGVEHYSKNSKNYCTGQQYSQSHKVNSVWRKLLNGLSEYTSSIQFTCVRLNLLCSH